MFTIRFEQHFGCWHESRFRTVGLAFRRCCCRTGLPRTFANLFCGGTLEIHARYDRLEFTSSAEVLLTLFRAVKSSINRTALVWGSAVAGSRVCERSGPCYRRAVFIGDDLAAQGSPCSSPPHREGAILGPVRRGLLSGTLESIDKHQYCGYATRSKSFLFRPCFSAQWTALNTGWTHRHLGGVAQRLHV